MSACQEGRLILAKYLVSKHGADPDYVDGRGMTPLFHACLRGHKELVEWLVCEVNADLHHMISIGGQVITSGMVALDQGHFKIAFFLARVEGWTTLHKAAFRGDVKVCKDILWKGDSSIDHKSASKETALAVAVSAAANTMAAVTETVGDNDQQKEDYLATIQVLEQASQPWRPKNNMLFPPRFRRVVSSILMIRHTLQKWNQGGNRVKRPMSELPMELWFMIVAFIPHDTFDDTHGGGEQKLTSTIAQLPDGYVMPAAQSILVAAGTDDAGHEA